MFLRTLYLLLIIAEQQRRSELQTSSQRYSFSLTYLGHLLGSSAMQILSTANGSRNVSWLRESHEEHQEPRQIIWLQYVNQQLRQGVAPDAILLTLSTSYSSTTLTEGYIHRALGALNTLLAQGANVNAQDDQGNSALLNFVRGIYELIDDVNNFSSTGHEHLCEKTLDRLMIFENAVKLLLSRGADIDLATTDGISARSIATTGVELNGCIRHAANPRLLELLISTPTQRVHINIFNEIRRELSTEDNNSTYRAVARRLSFSNSNSNSESD